MTITTPHLLERFLRYVRIDTEAVETSKTYPSSPGQLELGKMLMRYPHVHRMFRRAEAA